LHNYLNNKELNIDFEFLSEYIHNINLSGCPHHSNLPLIEVYEKIFNEKKEEMDFKFGVGAQFIVSKNSILKRSKSFYLKIVELLEYDVNPIEGYVIERFHNLFFE